MIYAVGNAVISVNGTLASAGVAAAVVAAVAAVDVCCVAAAVMVSEAAIANEVTVRGGRGVVAVGNVVEATNGVGDVAGSDAVSADDEVGIGPNVVGVAVAWLADGDVTEAPLGFF